MLPAKEDMTTIQIFSNLGNNRIAKVRFLFEKQKSFDFSFTDLNKKIGPENPGRSIIRKYLFHQNFRCSTPDFHNIESG